MQSSMKSRKPNLFSGRRTPCPINNCSDQFDLDTAILHSIKDRQESGLHDDHSDAGVTPSLAALYQRWLRIDGVLQALDCVI